MSHELPVERDSVALPELTVIIDSADVVSSTVEGERAEVPRFVGGQTFTFTCGPLTVRGRLLITCHLAASEIWAEAELAGMSTTIDAHAYLDENGRGVVKFGFRLTVGPFGSFVRYTISVRIRVDLRGLREVRLSEEGRTEAGEIVWTRPVL